MCCKHIRNQDGSANAQSGLAGAASQPGTSATWQPQRPAGQLSQACHADMHAMARRLPLLCVNRVWTVWCYVSVPTISVYFTNMLWTMVVVKNETSSTLKPVHRSVTVCTTRDETLRGLNAHRHRDEAYRPALCGGGREAVSPSTLLHWRREPRWRHSARGNEGHRTTNAKTGKLHSDRKWVWLYSKLFSVGNPVSNVFLCVHVLNKILLHV